MYKIQSNQSGSRSIDITEKHLETIEKYQLFRDLIDSHGFVDEQVLDKLKFNIRCRVLPRVRPLAASNPKSQLRIRFSTLNIQHTMYKIQSNQSGSRSIDITEKHLETIEKYQLFRDLIDSHGFVDEQVLDKLKFNIRSLLESESTRDNDLLDLCLDVIYHANMKSFGLQQLIVLFINWKQQKAE